MFGKITDQKIEELFGEKGNQDERSYNSRVARNLQKNFWNYNTGSQEFCKRLFEQDNERIFRIMTNQRGDLHNYLPLADVLLYTKSLDALLESARYFQPGNFRHPNDSEHVLSAVGTIARFTKDGDLLRHIIDITNKIQDTKYGKRPLCIMGDFPASLFLDYAAHQAMLLQDSEEVENSVDRVVKYVDVLDSLRFFVSELFHGHYGPKNKINKDKIAGAASQKEVLEALRSLPPLGSEVNQFFWELVSKIKQ